MSKKQEQALEEYPQDLVQWGARCMREFGEAKKAIKPWQEKGEEIDSEYRNEAAGSSGDGHRPKRLPLFAADVQTLSASLYGRAPRCTASRRHADAKDDVARVGSLLLERLMNTDIEREDDTYEGALGHCLTDWLLPGFAFAQCRYVTGDPVMAPGQPAQTDPVTGAVIAEAVPEVETFPNEDVRIDYVYWEDVLWGQARVFEDVPWWATRKPMSRKAFAERFGKEALTRATPATKKGKPPSPWERIEVWEIRFKAEKCIVWWVEGQNVALEHQPDPHGLPGFWLHPPPLMANATTRKYLPRPFYALHQDAYRKIDKLYSRMDELADAVRVAGLYDQASPEIKRLFSEDARNNLLGCKNWRALAEKGGLQGAIDWFPIEPVVQAIAQIQSMLSVEIDLLHQATGWSDILRGEATQAGATATEQRVKAKSGSTRINKMQDQFARFASGLLSIKAQLIAKHFSPETIAKRANAEFLPERDQQFVGPAIELIKSDISGFRIEVKPEAVAMADFAAIKSERTEVLATLAGFFQTIGPVVEAMGPESMPHLMRLAQWTVAGVRGSSEAEGAIDAMVTDMEQRLAQAKANPQPPQPSPEQMKVQATQMKVEGDIKKEQLKQQGEMQRLQAETFAKAQQEMVQREQNVLEAQQKAAISQAARAMAPKKPGGMP